MIGINNFDIGNKHGNKLFENLELDKIIARASEGCVCKEAREQLLALEPQCDPDEVRYALEQTDAINSLLIKTGLRALAG